MKIEARSRAACALSATSVAPLGAPLPPNSPDHPYGLKAEERIARLCRAEYGGVNLLLSSDEPGGFCRQEWDQESVSSKRVISRWSEGCLMRMDADFCPPAPPYDSFTVRPAKVNSRSRRLLSSVTTALLFSP